MIRRSRPGCQHPLWYLADCWLGSASVAAGCHLGLAAGLRAAGLDSRGAFVAGAPRQLPQFHGQDELLSLLHILQARSRRHLTKAYSRS